MKYMLFLHFSLLVFHLRAAKITTQYIAYEVPINLSYRTDNLESTGRIEKNYNVEYLRSNRITRLENEVRLKLVRTLFKKVKSAEIQVYKFDEVLYTGNVMHEEPSKYFKQAIHADSLEPYFGVYNYITVCNFSKDSHEHEGGASCVKKMYSPYKAEDVISFTFYENWHFNLKNNKMSKEVIGYTVNVSDYERTTGKFLGSTPLFYIKNNCRKGKGLNISTNYESLVRLSFEDSSGVRKVYPQWWLSGLSPQISTPFLVRNDHAPFLSTNKIHQFYNPYHQDRYDGEMYKEFPFNEEWSYEQVLDRCIRTVEVQVFDKESGEPLTDENWQPILETVRDPIELDEITHLAFVEEWFFDEKTLSITKKIKAIGPAITVYSERTSEPLDVKVLYYLAY